ncbi:MAG: hypothetical protein ACTHJ5_15765 [Ilyomonas sp.]
MNVSNLRIKQIVVFIAALALVFIPVLLIEYKVFNFTKGIFMYPLDDTFIHMTIAKNISLHDNWGMNTNEFASASSSILYSLLLAASFRVFSVQVIVPFIINAIAGVILMAVLQRWLQKQNIPALVQVIILACVIFFTPVPIIIISGMEHTLQCIFSFLFIFGFSRWLAIKLKEEKKERWKLPGSIFILGALTCSIRYEGMFIVAVVCLMLLYYRKIGLSFLLCIVSLSPLIIFGIYSVIKGSYFLPNSVLIKSATAPLSVSGIIHTISDILIDKLTIQKGGITSLATQRLLIILPLTYLIFYRQLKQNIEYAYILLILIFTTLLHLAFASTGWFYRYEAYLMLGSVTIIGVILYKYLNEISFSFIRKTSLIIIVALFALFFPLILRSTAAFSKAAQACINIYEQQFQMAKFVHEFYNNETVAANDIGAITFYKDGNNLDLWGLGNIEVARSREGNYYTPGFLDSLSRKKDADVAIVYDSWFSDSLLHKWNKVATWQIKNNVICGDDIVSFYAIDETAASPLKENLKKYQSSLPSDVTVKYY